MSYGHTLSSLSIATMPLLHLLPQCARELLVISVAPSWKTPISGQGSQSVIVAKGRPTRTPINGIEDVTARRCFLIARRFGRRRRMPHQRSITSKCSKAICCNRSLEMFKRSRRCVSCVTSLVAVATIIG